MRFEGNIIPFAQRKEKPIRTPTDTFVYSKRKAELVVSTLKLYRKRAEKLPALNYFIKM